MAGVGAIFIIKILFSSTLEMGVNVEAFISDVSGLGAVEDHKRKEASGENGDEVEGPLPAELVGHDSDNDRREERSSEQTEIAECHAQATFVDKVELSDTDVNQGFERRQTDSLEESCCYERIIALATCSSPYRGEDNDDGSQQVEMALAPNSSTGDEEEACQTYTKQMPAGQQGNLREALSEVERQGEGIRSEKW